MNTSSQVINSKVAQPSDPWTTVPQDSYSLVSVLDLEKFKAVYYDSTSWILSLSICNVYTKEHHNASFFIMCT